MHKRIARDQSGGGDMDGRGGNQSDGALLGKRLASSGAQSRGGGREVMGLGAGYHMEGWVAHGGW
jgi:hypothetical protein